MDTLLLHGLVEKERDKYTALCLELNVATFGDTVEEAETKADEPNTAEEADQADETDKIDDDETDDEENDEKPAESGE